MKRRELLQAGIASTAGAILHVASAAAGWPANTGFDFVRLSPRRYSEVHGRCRADVWYITLGADVYAAMATGSWHVQAARAGLSETEVSFLDPGCAPLAALQPLATLVAMSSVVADEQTIEAALRRFDAKYGAAWTRWGCRVRSGLADGSRTMLRYRLRPPRARALALEADSHRARSMTRLRAGMQEAARRGK